MSERNNLPLAPVLRRKVYSRLHEWKTHSRGRTAILLEGARRIGKSTIAREFAKQEYDSYIVVNFDNVDEQTKDLFVNKREHLDEIFNFLQVRYQERLIPRKSVIIFDEVQQHPQARSLIKQLVADGRYDYIETGSLISLRQNVQDIIIPSEEEKVRVYPLDFEEFLWAQGDVVTIPTLQEMFAQKHTLGPLHREMMNRFRAWVLVGGMPQAVVEYKQTGDLASVDEVKRGIINLYHQDIYKFGGGQATKATSIFDNIPGQLNKKSKRFQWSSLGENARFRTYEEAVVWLQESMMVNNCWSVSDPNIGLSLTADVTRLKCYLADTGMLVTQSFGEKPFWENEIYRSFLYGKMKINEGMIMENAVAQALVANGYRLYFYTNSDHDERENNLEIDFLITRGRKLNPIEVKSGRYNGHASLDKFKEKFGRRVGTRYVLHTKDVEVKDDVVYLPLYMAVCL